MAHQVVVALDQVVGRCHRPEHGGEPLGVTTGLQIHINTQRTRTPAEGLIGEIYFSSETKDVVVTEAAKEKMVAATPVLSSPRGKALPVAGFDDDFSRPGCVNIRVAFDTNSTQVDAIPKSSVQTIMEYLVKHPENTLVITGHTDSVGSDAFNLELSRRRAQSVKQYLVEQYAIDEHRLIILGAGESRPIADNDTPEGQAQNRRVTIQDCPR